MQIAFLKQNKASTEVLPKYLDFADIFLEKKILMLPKQKNFNKHVIKFKSNKQPFYKPIYSVRLIKFKTLKVYIKIYLKPGFIQLFKLFIGTSILFDIKLNSNFSLCINYNSLNNFIIKN